MRWVTDGQRAGLVGREGERRAVPVGGEGRQARALDSDVGDLEIALADVADDHLGGFGRAVLGAPAEVDGLSTQLDVRFRKRILFLYILLGRRLGLVGPVQVVIGAGRQQERDGHGRQQDEAHVSSGAETGAGDRQASARISTLCMRMGGCHVRSASRGHRARDGNARLAGVILRPPVSSE